MTDSSAPFGWDSRCNFSCFTDVHADAELFLIPFFNACGIKGIDSCFSLENRNRIAQSSLSSFFYFFQPFPPHRILADYPLLPSILSLFSHKPCVFNAFSHFDNSFFMRTLTLWQIADEIENAFVFWLLSFVFVLLYNNVSQHERRL